MNIEQTLYVTATLLRHYGEHPQQDCAIIAGVLELLEGAQEQVNGAPTKTKRSTDGSGEIKKAPKKTDAASKQQEPKEPKRPPFDTGKMISLYNAGWSAAMVADEMGVSVATIYSRAKKEGLKFGKAQTQEGN